MSEMNGIELALIESAKPHQIHDALQNLYEQVMRAEKWNDEKGDQIITANAILKRAIEHVGGDVMDGDSLVDLVACATRRLVELHRAAARIAADAPPFDPVEDPEDEEMPF